MVLSHARATALGLLLTLFYGVRGDIKTKSGCVIGNCKNGKGVFVWEEDGGRYEGQVIMLPCKNRSFQVFIGYI